MRDGYAYAHADSPTERDGDTNGKCLAGSNTHLNPNAFLHGLAHTDPVAYGHSEYGWRRSRHVDPGRLLQPDADSQSDQRAHRIADRDAVPDSDAVMHREPDCDPDSDPVAYGHSEYGWRRSRHVDAGRLLEPDAGTDGHTYERPDLFSHLYTGVDFDPFARTDRARFLSAVRPRDRHHLDGNAFEPRGHC